LFVAMRVDSTSLAQTTTGSAAAAAVMRMTGASPPSRKP
jgi:hypothetical protein